MNKFMKILILIIALISIVLISLFVAKFNKINEIINLMKINSEIDNYYFENSDMIIKRYKDIVYIIPGSHLDFYYYYNFKLGKVYIIDEDNKTYYEEEIENSDKSVLEFPLYSYLTKDFSLKNEFKLVFKWKIKDFDNDKYEIITENDDKIVFDRNTGFILNVNGVEYGNILINKIDESDIPDINTYTVLEWLALIRFETFLNFSFKSRVLWYN